MNHGAPAVEPNKRLSWFRRIVQPRRTVSQTPDHADAVDFLLAFDAEASRPPVSATRATAPRRRASPPTRTWLMLLAASALAAAAVPAVGQLRAMAAKPAAPTFGRVSIDTRPPGVKVIVDGENRGASPLTLSLKTGPHAFALFNGLDQRDFQIQVTTGSETSHYVEFAAAAAVPSTGAISIAADTVGKVTVDGHPRGTTPLTLDNVLAGSHTVVVTSEAGRLERTVTVDPGATASIVFSNAKSAGPTVGWLAIAAPFDVQDLSHRRSRRQRARCQDHADRRPPRRPAREHDPRLRKRAARRVAAGKVETVQVESADVHVERECAAVGRRRDRRNQRRPDAALQCAHSRGRPVGSCSGIRSSAIRRKPSGSP